MVNRKVVKVLQYRYMFLATVLVILAAGLVLLPKFNHFDGLNPEELLNNSISTERYISSDALADLYINEDPSYLVIDLRGLESYNSYHLPSAIHIPLDSLLTEDSMSYLDQDQFDLVFISQDNIIADQAWLICDRMKFKNIRVLQGGMNAWYSTIINPQKPVEGMPAKAFETYSFRKAASMYFGVAYPEDVKVVKPIVKPAPKKVVPKKKKKKMPMEGGC